MDIQKIVNVFNIREVEKQVFEKLIYKSDSSATEIARETGLSRTSIYDILESLIKTGLVKESASGSKKVFSVQDIKSIQKILDDKKKDLKDAETLIEKISETQKKTEEKAPLLQLYKGRSDLQKMMNHMLAKENTHVLSYWPINTVEELLTEEFFEEFHKKRIEKNITVDMILPGSSKKIITEKIKGKYFKKINIRFAPKDINFSLGYSIYDQTVRFISSKQENFGFLIESNELVETMAGQFKVIWNLSK
jgi:sugar-specific transcriptional regulator TrmB